MARTPQGKEVLEKAKGLLPKARTAEELRMLQAVILPLEFGFSLERTAAITGMSKGWASHIRMQFIRSRTLSGRKSHRGGRRRQNMGYEEEKAFLAPFFEKAAAGGILVVSADHGNADDMYERDGKSSKVILDPHTGRPKPKTAHSLNPVPFYLYEPTGTIPVRLSDHAHPGISSLAATCLKLLGFVPPEDYTPSMIEIE